jgi:Leucine-rich repeat (LRR) protein
MVTATTFSSLLNLDFDYHGSATLKTHIEDWLSASSPHQKPSRYKVAHLILSAAHNHLSELSLEGFGLESLPEGIDELTHLEDLNLSKNRLQELPIHFEFLTRLKKINLSDNQLSSLPKSFPEMTLLESLDLSKNRFEELCEIFYLLPNIRYLNLEHNLLGSLPFSILTLQNIEYLKLAHNRFRVLPDEIGHLYGLKELSLQANQLTKLPHTLTELSELKFLNLAHNLLQFIPAHIGRMSLKSISVAHNPIEQLPFSFLFSIGFHHIDVEGTPIPPSMGRCLDQIPTRERYGKIRTLKTAIRFLSCWSTETAPKGVPYTLRESRDLIRWLEHLSSSEVFAQNQVFLANTIFSLLCEAEKNMDFREAFFLQLFDNTHRCGDRAAYTLILLHALKEMHQKVPLRPEQRFQILVAAAKTLHLQKIVRQILIPKKGCSEDVEIQLYAMLMLKDRLNLILPLDSIQMTYKDLAEQTIGPNHEALLEAVVSKMEEIDPIEMVIGELPQILDSFLEEFFSDELNLIKETFEQKFLGEGSVPLDPILQEVHVLESSCWLIEEKKALLMKKVLPF